MSLSGGDAEVFEVIKASQHSFRCFAQQE